jgi:lysophospholipase L1-like esterase
LQTAADSRYGRKLGVLAFGDSITNGGGELQWGVALQSWTLWVARGLGLPFTSYATDGHRAADVVTRQLTAFTATTADPGAGYELGCLYIGVNDVRAPDWNRSAFERDFELALSFLHDRCERVLTVTVPLDLGRPRTGPKVVDCNDVIVGAAARHRALVLDLSDFGARNQVMVDRVHPTAFGQIAIAERALRVLARDGMTVRAAPSSLISYRTGWRRRLRGDATYVYRHLKVSAGGLARSLRR